MKEKPLFEPQKLEKGAKLFSRPCRFMLSVADFSQLPDGNLPEIAFAGRSNVGKSSLFNALFNQKNLAKTSSTPGRTQQLNFFNFDERLYMVDLPGYGFAKAPNAAVKQWQDLNFDYLRGRPNLRRVFLMIDARLGIKKIDQSTMDLLDDAAVCYQIVLTKIDKISNKELNAVLAEVQTNISKHPAAYQTIICTSSAKKIGLENLKAEIAELLEA